MIKKIKVLVLLFSLSFSTSCALLNKNKNIIGQSKKLSIGMSLQEVLNVMGPAYESYEESESSSKYSYLSYKHLGMGRGYSCTLVVLHIDNGTKQLSEIGYEDGNSESSCEEKNKYIAETKDRTIRQAHATSIAVAIGAIGVAALIISTKGYAGGGSSYSPAYVGNCPCPYSIANDGSVCGARSAYSRSGGASPICY